LFIIERVVYNMKSPWLLGRAIANLKKAGLKPATDNEKSPQRLDVQRLWALFTVRSRIGCQRGALLSRSSRLSDLKDNENE